ncbi:aquaporin-like protein [Tulasnella sp. JGI-2019a]|nr:aquaporin-like protein [Tulasnella sp. JGI-2019a]
MPRRAFLRNPDGSLLASVKQDMEAAVLEFCGTFIFLLLGLGGIQAAAVSNESALSATSATDSGGGVSVNRVASIDQLIYISASMGLSLLIAHRSTPFAPIGIGLTLFACHLFAVVFTGASMNTARSFGPAVVSGFPDAHWVYWLGPFLGSLLATFFYSLLKHIKYWQINPGQDAPDPRLSPPGPIDTIRGVTSRNGNELDVGSETTAADTGRMGGMQEKHASVAPPGHATVNGPNVV